MRIHTQAFKARCRPFSGTLLSQWACACPCGLHGTTRTSNLSVRSRVLFQLSYAEMCGRCRVESVREFEPPFPA